VSVYFDTVSAAVGIDGSPVPDGTYWAASAFMQVAANTTGAAICLSNDAGDDYVAFVNNSQFFALESNSSATNIALAAIDTWYHVYILSDNTGIYGGVRNLTGTVYVTNSRAANAVTSPTKFTIGDYQLSGYSASRTVLASVKVWSGSGNLPTTAELQEEGWTKLPRKREPLWGCFPLRHATDLLNLSASSVSPSVLSSNGSPVTRDDPPVPWGGYPIWVNASTSSNGDVTAVTATGSGLVWPPNVAGSGAGPSPGSIVSTVTL